MKGSYPDWTSLPAEILSKIFHYPEINRELLNPYDLSHPDNTQCDLSQAALVCKAWINPVQSSMYSEVVICTISQLEKFRDTIEYNTYLGTKVKLLILKIQYISDSEKAVLLDIVTNLLSNRLPNLEYLCQNGRSHSYLPTLNALLDSKLKYLKRIQIPIYEDEGDWVAHYVSCAFLMRDRLQEVFITNDLPHFWDKSTSKLGIIKFQKLYDNLYQFNNLTKISIKNRTDDGAQLLEYIVETCRSLRDIKLTLLSSMNNMYDDVQPEDNIYLDKISHYIPRTNIKTISAYLYMSTLENSKVLLYIIKKFPNLEELNLNYRKMLQITPYAILQVLNHSVQIKNFYVSNLNMNQGDVYNIIENFWNTSSKPGIEKVKFSYYHHQDIEKKFYCHLHKNPVQEAELKLGCPLQLGNRQPHIDLIEKNGKFIGDLTLQFHFNYDGRCDAPENFLFHIFMHCPKLRSLHIDNFKLQECLHSKFDETKKYSIEKFTLKDCEIIPGVLDQLSTVLSEVKQFRFIDTTWYDDDDEYNDSRYISHINMSQTKIQHITLGLISKYYPAHVKLFVVTEQKYYYYQSDTNSDTIESSESGTIKGIRVDEKVYDEGRNAQKFSVCCQTKPEILFKYCYFEAREGFF